MAIPFGFIFPCEAEEGLLKYSQGWLSMLCWLVEVSPVLPGLPLDVGALLVTLF